MAQTRGLSIRTRSVLIGAFILIAYGVLITVLTEAPLAVMIADIISGLAVIGIAVLLYPLVRVSDRYMPTAYLILKWAEGILMVLAGILFFLPEYRHMRELVYDGAHLYVFIISGALFYVLLYRRKLVPRYICIWGMAGIASLAISSILTLIGRPLAFLDAFLVLIITNEVYLAVWLFTKDLRYVETEDGRRTGD